MFDRPRAKDKLAPFFETRCNEHNQQETW